MVAPVVKTSSTTKIFLPLILLLSKRVKAPRIFSCLARQFRRACGAVCLLRAATSVKSSRRLQAFEGIVISKKNGSVRETFTVRRVSFGVGIERSFPLHSPRIDRIEVVRRGKVRRAKLYYLRKLSGKAAKIAEKI